MPFVPRTEVRGLRALSQRHLPSEQRTFPNPAHTRRLKALSGEFGCFEPSAPTQPWVAWTASAKRIQMLQSYFHFHSWRVAIPSILNVEKPQRSSRLRDPKELLWSHKGAQISPVCNTQILWGQSSHRPHQGSHFGLGKTLAWTQVHETFTKLGSGKERLTPQKCLIPDLWCADRKPTPSTRTNSTSY